MNDIGEKIGDLLRDVRKQRGLSQRDLAQRLSITQDAISDIEKGTRILKITELFEIAQVLEIPPSYFLFVNEEQKRLVIMEACLEALSSFPEPLLEAANTLINELGQIRILSEEVQPGWQQKTVELEPSSLADDQAEVDFILSGNLLVEAKKRRSKNSSTLPKQRKK